MSKRRWDASRVRYGWRPEMLGVPQTKVCLSASCGPVAVAAGALPPVLVVVVWVGVDAGAQAVSAARSKTAGVNLVRNCFNMHEPSISPHSAAFNGSRQVLLKTWDRPGGR